MNRTLVIEGPDGAGKTTLIRQLREDTGMALAPRFSTSTGGPKANIADLCAADMVNPHEAIYDRHPAISEPIYARALGRPMDSYFRTPRFHIDRAEFFATRPLVICLPSLDTIKQNLTAEDQLEGVVDNIKDIFKQYVSLLLSPSRYYPIYAYNYALPGAYQNLRSELGV